jgi:hypothetical protein
MATIVGAARQPFALLTGPRLQHLLNTRNGQNGMPKDPTIFTLQQ